MSKVVLDPKPQEWPDKAQAAFLKGIKKHLEQQRASHRRIIGEITGWRAAAEQAMNDKLRIAFAARQAREGAMLGKVTARATAVSEALKLSDGPRNRPPNLLPIHSPRELSEARVRQIVREEIASELDARGIPRRPMNDEGLPPYGRDGVERQPGFRNDDDDV